MSELLLIVEDDAAFARTLRRSFERRGYRVLSADGAEGVDALLAAGERPTRAVVDLKLAGNTSGLACVRTLRAALPTARIVVLIVEDDAAFARTLRRSFERRGYRVLSADGAEGVDALLAAGERPTRAVVDLKLAGNTSGLACVRTLRAALPTARIVVLTGFASIATAVEAIKLGADHYLAKPSNTDDIEAAFARTDGDADTAVDGRQSSIKTLEWEHIHQTLVACDFNISEAARRLGMHRRTLARKLEKRPVR